MPAAYEHFLSYYRSVRANTRRTEQSSLLGMRGVLGQISVAGRRPPIAARAVEYLRLAANGYCAPGPLDLIQHAQKLTIHSGPSWMWCSRMQAAGVLPLLIRQLSMARPALFLMLIARPNAGSAVRPQVQTVATVAI
jgi:hypothetical protein